jgi:hypothetical protein
MPISFEGFPRNLDRGALKPGRWFVAAEGLRPVLCLATDVMENGEPVALTFSAPAVELINFSPILLSVIDPPYGTLEDEIVFAPGLLEGAPTLVAPARRTFSSGALVRLRSGDMGIGFVTTRGGEMHVVSLSTGQSAEGFDLVFERWSLTVRRGDASTLVGYFKPLHTFADRRRG